MEPITAQDIQRYQSKENPQIHEWTRNLTPNTLELYIRYLIQFERQSNISLEQLLTQLDETDNKTIRLKQIRTLIINTIEGLSPHIQNQMVSAIRSLFKYHAHAIPPTTIKVPKGKRKRGYTKQELQALIEYLDNPLEKLYVIITAESGLRAETTLKLKWEHVQHDFNTRTGSIALRLEESFYMGRKRAGYTFIGPRSRELIQHSIEQELIQTQPATSLFPYTYHSISAIIQRANAKARNDPTLQELHGLRHYFIETIQLSELRIDGHHQEVIIGRFSDVDAKHYTTSQFEQLRPDYDRAYPYLDYRNNSPTQTQELSTRQTELQDIINQQNQRIQRLEQRLQLAHQADTGIVTILQSPTALRRTADFAEFLHSKNVTEVVLSALDTLNYPQTDENIDIATRAYFEANPQIFKEFREKHPELTDPSENQKLLAELKGGLAYRPTSAT